MTLGSSLTSHCVLTRNLQVTEGSLVALVLDGVLVQLRFSLTSAEGLEHAGAGIQPQGQKACPVPVHLGLQAICPSKPWQLSTITPFYREGNGLRRGDDLQWQVGLSPRGRPGKQPTGPKERPRGGMEAMSEAM